MNNTGFTTLETQISDILSNYSKAKIPNHIAVKNILTVVGKCELLRVDILIRDIPFNTEYNTGLRDGAMRIIEPWIEYNIIKT